jgi:hypothetical protein
MFLPLLDQPAVDDTEAAAGGLPFLSADQSVRAATRGDVGHDEDDDAEQPDGNGGKRVTAARTRRRRARRALV